MPASRKGPVTAIDDSAAGRARLSGGGGDIFGLIDESSLNEELVAKNKNHTPENPHPFAAYIHRVIVKSGVPDAQETREMASYICGVVARLPFLPEDTEFDQQVEKTARKAEETLDSDMVWTASAVKIARVALEMRRDDPENAWINDPLPGQRVAVAA